MTRPALAACGAALRIGAAAVLCAVPLGLKWSQTFGYSSPGVTIYGYCNDYGYCTPDLTVGNYYQPGATTFASQADVRLPLVVAVLALMLWTVRPTRSAIRIAAGSLILALALALAHRNRDAVLLLATALVLVAGQLRDVVVRGITP